jgi:hypothetical protein
MSYDILATSATPALIVYVIDASGSMLQPLGNERRIDVVREAFTEALCQMIFRSTKGSIISRRYKLAMFAYSDHVYDVLGNIKTVDQVAQMGVPELFTMRGTDTFQALLAVKRLLAHELPNLAASPAPLVCHITDGEYDSSDPEPIARRIMNMEVKDGKVLLQNILISDHALEQPITDLRRSTGILPDTKLVDEYARKLRSCSSPMPNSYWEATREEGYAFDHNTLMLFPVNSPDLVRLSMTIGIARSASTLIAKP